MGTNVSPGYLGGVIMGDLFYFLNPTMSAYPSGPFDWSEALSGARLPAECGGL